MIKILRASAGSGKTYSLAKTYIRLLLSDSDPVAYRHILAVTFTNKATDEMKSRILKELHLLATDPEKSSYISDFVPSLLPTTEELKKKAGDLLLRILHDYSAFSVSTIDRFFQQTLKAFSREIGQFASYQVELDQKSLVAETVDRILDSLTEDDKGMLNWLSDSMMEQLEKGERPKLEKSLNDVANRLKSDEHRAVIEENGIDEEKAYSKESLTHMRKLMRSVISSYEKDMREAAAEVEKAFSDNGISPNDTSSGFIGKNLLKITGVKPGEEIRDFTDTFKRDASDFSKWFRKNDQPKYAGLEGALAPPVAKLLSIYRKGSKAYRTAHILIKQIGGLGIASELRTEFQTLLKEKNVMSLDDSNVILKNIIDGADAPFIYEKLGTRFEHFLLDEFQDTSRVQWDNFRPLISNSDSQGFENLLVGDVKQSIYRWRGSDWKLMAKDVAEQFPRAGQESLKGNWRSLRGLVEFNDDFFAYAAGRLDNKHGSQEAGLSVSTIYGQREDKGFERQEAMTKDTAEGLVEAIFCDAEDQDQYILQTIREVMEAGALPGDITILVRNNTEGSHVASMLMDEGYNVISDDSLRLKSSPAVRKLVSLLASVRNPEDTIGSFLAREAGFDAGELSYHSLPDLCERLVRILKAGEDRESFDSETLYLQSFMDYVQDHVATNGNSLDSFLKSWEDGEDPKVSSPSDTGAVRVMTIHKSKGLEFPYVILPYSDKVGLYRSGTSWTVPDVEGTALEKMGKAAFDVSLSSKSEGTLFEEDYQKDRLLQYIDNITCIMSPSPGPRKE
ncbi:MAG: UvrD-helicase domain-containing protein [Bacteroidales bacterium]|nr:UvrD-helicase domain-containing protein [Bacteroidales bacterium]